MFGFALRPSLNRSSNRRPFVISLRKSRSVSVWFPSHKNWRFINGGGVVVERAADVLEAHQCGAALVGAALDERWRGVPALGGDRPQAQVVEQGVLVGATQLGAALEQPSGTQRQPQIERVLLQSTPELGRARRAYIAAHHPDLWMIEANATYRGWFLDEDSPEQLTNEAFYPHFIQGRGAMGKAFQSYYDGILKMGDSPSLTYVLNGEPENPLTESWGGRFVPISRSSRRRFEQQSTLTDTVAAYEVLEWRFPGPEREIPADSACFQMEIQGQVWPGYYLGEGIYGIRYSSKKPEIGSYQITSEIPELDGLSGQYVSITPWPGPPSDSDYGLGKNWYGDVPDSAEFIGVQQGAGTVAKHREAFLRDWAARWAWVD